jgi:hypothetical protein
MLLLLIDMAYDGVALLAQPPPLRSPSPLSDGKAVPPCRLRHGCSLACGRGCSVSVVKNPTPRCGRLCGHARGCGRGSSSVRAV